MGNSTRSKGQPVPRGKLTILCINLMKHSIFVFENTIEKLTKLVFLQIITYEKDSSACAAFLINNHTKEAGVINFRGVDYYLPEKSISILPDCKTVVYNTQTVNFPIHSPLMKEKIILFP